MIDKITTILESEIMIEMKMKIKREMIFAMTMMMMAKMVICSR